jgi:hypothetical protein
VCMLYWLISDSHSSKYEDGSLLGCCIILFGRSLLMFQRCLLSPSSGWWVTHCSDDGGSKHLWSICKLLADSMVQQLRRQPSLLYCIDVVCCVSLSVWHKICCYFRRFIVLHLMIDISE